MNRYLYIFCLVFITFQSSSSLQENKKISFEEIFGDRYAQAIHLTAINKKGINEILASDSILANQIIAIIFPELLRYSPTQDLIETQAMKLLYENYGYEDAVDFSIGYLQMKPSFIENLENYILQNAKFEKFQKLCTYQSSELKVIRKERLSRLEDFNWQFYYLHCFYHILQDKFPHFKDLNTHQKVLFSSTAYNRGFHCTEQEIKRWEKIENFPMGRSFFKQNTKQYIYGQVALDYFLRQQ